MQRLPASLPYAGIRPLPPVTETAVAADIECESEIEIEVHLAVWKRNTQIFDGRGDIPECIVGAHKQAESRKVEIDNCPEGRPEIGCPVTCRDAKPFCRLKVEEETPFILGILSCYPR